MSTGLHQLFEGIEFERIEKQAVVEHEWKRRSSTKDMDGVAVFKVVDRKRMEHGWEGNAKRFFKKRQEIIDRYIIYIYIYYVLNSEEK